MKLSLVMKIVLVAMAMTLTPVALQDLPPINENNLDPAAAHVCQETQKEPYTQTISFTQYYVQSTTTWCLAIPPRCTQYRIAARTAYKTETYFRTRVRYFCCEGYKPLPQHSYCVPRCVNDCNANQSHGYCVAPGNCICYPGYKGDTCQSGCATDKWGPDCSNTCNCGTHGSCDPQTGSCICHIGYTGQTCSQPCVNSFGLHCVHPCVCENNSTCNNVNGMCTCQPGYYGAYCHKKCDTTSLSESACQQTCPCQNGGTCQQGNGACVCAAGFKGDYCTEACDRFHWGLNCSQQCLCNFGVCNPATGQCTCELGYSGQRCEIKCPDGYYGVGCLTKCGCENDGKCYWNSTTSQIRCNCSGTGFHGDTCSERDCPSGQYLLPGAGQNQSPCRNCTCVAAQTVSCHPLTGKCLCSAGYKGETCSEKCAMPFYGKKCEEVCLCPNGDCHHITGLCVTPCYAGYIGSNCSQVCPSDRWGVDCINTCDCENKASCHPGTGYCECKAGFFGRSCEKYCPIGSYGPGCAHNCTCDTDVSICNPYDGQCQCKLGYMGPDCHDVCPPWKYDFYCMKDCDCNRTGASSCERSSGLCNCKAGWSGVKCETQCPAHTWGPGCINTCDCSGRGSCHTDLGHCLCLDGYQGDRCQQDANGVVVSVAAQQTGGGLATASTSNLIVAIVIPSVVFLIIIVAVVVYFMRKIKRIKDENYQVNFHANGSIPGQTDLPNGNAHVGVVNPTYEEDNRRNDSRYPHLSQRLSVAPPPLPQRQRCDEIDIEKLRVTVPDTDRRVSSHYADIDDLDRYTTLKSVSNPTLTSATAERGTGEFDTGSFECESDLEDEGESSRSTTQKVGGVDNPAYADGKNDSSENNSSCDMEELASSTGKNTRQTGPSDPDSRRAMNMVKSKHSDPFVGYLDMNGTSQSVTDETDTKSPYVNPYDVSRASISTGLHGNRALVSSDGYMVPVTAASVKDNSASITLTKNSNIPGYSNLGSDLVLDFFEKDLPNVSRDPDSLMFHAGDKKLLLNAEENNTDA